MQKPTKNLRVRPATPDDIERLVAIHTLSFPDPRGHEPRVRNFTANPLGGIDRLRIVVDEDHRDRIIGHAFFFAVEIFIGGRAVRTGAIATVGVEPASRGAGVAAFLVAEIEREALRDGIPLTMLYAYRQGFYTRLGYAPTSPYQRLRLVPRSLFSLKGSARDPIADIVVQTAEGDERADIERCYEMAGARSNGYLRRSIALWDACFADERAVYVIARDSSGALAGACAYRLLQAEPHAKVVLHVEDLFARDDAAARALLLHFAAFKDQCAEVHVSVALDDPLAYALVDADANRFGDAIVEHAIGDVCAGPLVRLLDVTAVLRARGYAADGETTIRVGHEAIHLSVKGGRAVAVAAALENAEIDLEDSVGSVVVGGLSLRDAVRLGRARAVDDAALARAHELLATSPFFSHDAF